MAALEPVVLLGTTVPAVAVVAYGTVIGVVVDVDHLCIARLKTGNWDAARFCLANPIAAVMDQDRIFDAGDVGVLSRLLSHLVIAGVVVSTLALASTSLAVLTAVVLYVHVLSDVAWDIRRLGRRADAAPEDLLRSIR